MGVIREEKMKGTLSRGGGETLRRTFVSLYGVMDDLGDSSSESSE